MSQTNNKEYEFNQDVQIEVLLKSGFTIIGNNALYKKVLYRCDDTKQPYVELRIWVENFTHLIVSVTSNGGDLYFPFINPELQHDNLVYEKVNSSYNNEMEKLVRKKILKHKHKEKKRNGGNN